MRRAQVFQNVQMGAEAVPGTAVAATLKLVQTQIAPRPVTALDSIRADGAQGPVGVARGKELTEAEFEGALSYTECMPFLSSMLAQSPAGTFKSGSWSPPGITTYTVEVGNASRAERFAYGVTTSLRLRFTKAEAAISGRMIGRALQEGAAFTAGLSPVAHAPVNPDKVDILVGDTILGLAQVDEFLEAEFSIQNRFGPVFALDSAVASFSDIVPRAPDMSAQLVIPHEAAAAAYMTDLRACTRKFCRITAAETIGSTAYSLQLTFPFVFSENTRGEQDDVYASTYTLLPVYDDSFGGWFEIVVSPAA